MLVTGHTGFKGTRLCRTLINAGAKWLRGRVCNLLRSRIYFHLQMLKAK